MNLFTPFELIIKVGRCLIFLSKKVDNRCNDTEKDCGNCPDGFLSGSHRGLFGPNFNDYIDGADQGNNS